MVLFNVCQLWRSHSNTYYLSIFRKHAISYFNPQLSEWSTRHIPLEASVKENCRLLLFVISEGTRATSSMLEVSQCISSHHALQTFFFFFFFFFFWYIFIQLHALQTYDLDENNFFFSLYEPLCCWWLIWTVQDDAKKLTPKID